MKTKVVVLLVLLITIGTKAKAQDWMELNHEISLSYGVLPALDILDRYENYFKPAENSVHYYDDKGRFGSFNLSYLIFPDEVMGIGLIYSYTNADKKISHEGKAIGTFVNSFHTIAPSFKYNWFNADWITLYSRANIGITIATGKGDFYNKNQHQTEERSKVRCFLMYQASPIGIELGRQVAGFVEAGFGHMGTVMAGVRYRM